MDALKGLVSGKPRTPYHVTDIPSSPYRIALTQDIDDNQSTKEIDYVKRVCYPSNLQSSSMHTHPPPISLVKHFPSRYTTTPVLGLGLAQSSTHLNFTQQSANVGTTWRSWSRHWRRRWRTSRSSRVREWRRRRRSAWGS